MKITSELIQAYINGSCSPEEEALVKEWFMQNPEQLRIWMNAESWEEFNPETTSVEASPRMFEYIVKKTTRKRLASVRWVAAASTIVVLFAVGMFWKGAKTKENNPVALSPQAVIPQMISRKNQSGKDQWIVLSDRSVVKLSPGSSLQYDSVFGVRRDIYLTGVASFTVFKDSLRPFCVHSKYINVTALGTIFSVSDYDSLLTTTVKLFEGKVVIRKDKEVKNTKPIKEIFLTPGQELRFNKMDYSYSVDLMKETVVGPKVQVAKVKSKVVPELNFNNRPLAEIFKELQLQYGVNIHFESAESEDLRFTGIHKPASETLEDFLNILALLNDLTITKKNKGFVITTK